MRRILTARVAVVEILLLSESPRKSDLSLGLVLELVLGGIVMSKISAVVVGWFV